MQFLRKASTYGNFRKEVHLDEEGSLFQRLGTKNRRRSIEATGFSEKSPPPPDREHQLPTFTVRLKKNIVMPPLSTAHLSKLSTPAHGEKLRPPLSKGVPPLEVSRNELAKEALFGFHRKTITAFGNYATKLLGSFESEELAAKKYAGKLINIQDKLKNTNVAELCRPQ